MKHKLNKSEQGSQYIQKPLPHLTLTHLRTAQLDLPGEVWDQFFFANGDRSRASQILAEHSLLIDLDRNICLLNVASFLSASSQRKSSKKRNPVATLAQQAQEMDYDLLLIVS